MLTRRRQLEVAQQCGAGLLTVGNSPVERGMTGKQALLEG